MNIQNNQGIFKFFPYFYKQQTKRKKFCVSQSKNNYPTGISFTSQKNKLNKINIGFIGGCINHQGGIDREDLYYSVASKLLSGTQTEHQIILGSYHAVDQLVDQTKKFIEINTNKTNYEYVMELRKHKFANEFASLTLQYEYVWYGEYPVDERLFEQIQGSFTQFNKNNLR